MDWRNTFETSLISILQKYGFFKSGVIFLALLHYAISFLIRQLAQEMLLIGENPVICLANEIFKYSLKTWFLTDMRCGKDIDMPYITTFVQTHSELNY